MINVIFVSLAQSDQSVRVKFMTNKFTQAYKNEVKLIEANGGDKAAVQIRRDELQHQRLNLLERIEQRLIEFAAREKALDEAVSELNE